MFRQYMHIEKLGNVEVEGIELGVTYIFPKIDGTNASVWKEYTVHSGSRTRELSIDADNAGFCSYVDSNENLKKFLNGHSNMRLYGEWLVPHTLKTYREEAWRKFYIFDVFDNESEQYVPYPVYKDYLEKYNLDYIAPIAIIKNGNSEQFFKCLEKNNFLITDGSGIGEGVVIKNYGFYNRFGNQVWAKLITSEFKEKHTKTMGAPEIGCEPVELQISNKFITAALVDKVYAKIVNECEGWTNKYIPRLLETVFYDLIKEEMWEILKGFKNPQINFKALKAFSISRIKELKKDIF